MQIYKKCTFPDNVFIMAFYGCGSDKLSDFRLKRFRGCRIFNSEANISAAHPNCIENNIVNIRSSETCKILYQFNENNPQHKYGKEKGKGL